MRSTASIPFSPDLKKTGASDENDRGGNGGLAEGDEREAEGAARQGRCEPLAWLRRGVAAVRRSNGTPPRANCLTREIREGGCQVPRDWWAAFQKELDLGS